jgi:hypothetical protein
MWDIQTNSWSMLASLAKSTSDSQHWMAGNDGLLDTLQIQYSARIKT